MCVVRSFGIGGTCENKQDSGLVEMQLYRGEQKQGADIGAVTSAWRAAKSPIAELSWVATQKCRCDCGDPSQDTELGRSLRNHLVQPRWSMVSINHCGGN